MRRKYLSTFLAATALVVLVMPQTATAAKLYWIGPADADFNLSSNWSAAVGGAAGGTSPANNSLEFKTVLGSTYSAILSADITINDLSAQANATGTSVPVFVGGSDKMLTFADLSESTSMKAGCINLGNRMINGNNLTFNVGTISFGTTAKYSRNNSGSSQVIINSKLVGSGTFYTGLSGTSNTGQYTLNGDNSGFSGGFSLGYIDVATAGTVNYGGRVQLNINNANALGTGALTFAYLRPDLDPTNRKHYIDNTSGAPVTLASPVSIVADTDIRFLGTNNLDLGASSFNIGSTGGTRILDISDAGFDGTTLTIGGQISGSNSIQKEGGGHLILSGVGHTFTGTTTITKGTMSFTGNGVAANGIFSNSTSRTFKIDSGVNVGLLNFSGEWSLGTANKIITGGSNSLINTAQADSHLYINDLTTSGGKIQGTGFRVGKDSDAIFATPDIANGSNTDITAPIYMEKTASATQLIIDLKDTNPNGGEMTIAADIADVTGYEGMTLVKRGAGSLLLRRGTADGSGKISFSGKTIVEAGTLKLGSLNFDGLLSGNLEVYSGANVILASGGTDTEGYSNRSAIYEGSISGTGGISQVYGGTITYNGENTYTGDTYVDGLYVQNVGGSLLMDVNNAGDSSQILQYTASSYTVFGGSVSLNGELNLDVSDVSESAGSWNLIDSALSMAYNMTGVNLIDGASTLSFTGSGANWSCVNGADLWTFTDAGAGSAGVLSLTVVPEPSTLAMLSAALLGLIAYAWRKRK